MKGNCERCTSECNDFPLNFNTRAGRSGVGAVNRRTRSSINGTSAMDDFAFRMRASRARVGTEWPTPKPLPNSLAPVAPFSLEFLADRLAPWVGDIADR